MTDKKKLKEILDKIRREQEFFKEINLEEQPGSASAVINLETHELNISYDPKFPERLDEETKKYLEKKNISLGKAVETLVIDLLIHEIGHRGNRKSPGCPKDVKTLSKKFLDPIYEVTKIESKKKLSYFSNLLEDIINNTINKRFDKDTGTTEFVGYYLFLKEQGMLNGAYGKLYEASSRLQLYFNGDQLDKKLLKPYLNYDTEVNQAVRNFLERTGISKMKSVVYQGAKEIMVRDRLKIRDYLMDENNWENISTIFAEEFAKFITDNEQLKENLFGSSGNQQDQGSTGQGNGQNSNGQQNGNDKSGDETSGNEEIGGQTGNPVGGADGEDEKDGDLGNEIIKQVLEELENTFNDSNGFGQELNDLDNIKKIIRGRKAGHGPGWMSNFEYLVAYYESLASDKLLELSLPPLEGKTYPLVEMGERRFSVGDDPVSNIRGVFFDNEKKDLELYVAEFIHDIDVKVKKSLTNKPDFVFGLLDTSSSMLEAMPKGRKLGEVVSDKGAVPWNINSKYHVSLITYFMLVERLNELGIYESDAFFANFSYDTIFSQGLMNSKIEALCPQFGGTQINIDKIKKFLRKEGMLVFTISDGEIENDSELLEEFERISSYNHCFHVQIGNHSSFSKMLKKLCVYVKQVKEEKELYNFIIDMTEKVYGEYKND